VGLEDGDCLASLAAGDPAKFSRFAGDARTRAGENSSLSIELVRALRDWSIIPFYEWDGGGQEGRNSPTTRVLDAPGGMEALVPRIIDAEGLSVRLVCNGFEIASGSIRNQSPS